MLPDLFLKRTFNSRMVHGWSKQNKLGFVLLPWLASAMCILMAKVSMLLHGAYPPYDEIASSLRTPPVLYFWEKAAFFRSDMLCYFFFVPLVFCLLTCRFSPRWRLVIATLGAFFALALVNAEFVVFITTGAFLSLKVMWDSVLWAIKSQSIAFIWVPALTIFKLAATFVAVGLATLIAVAALHFNFRWLNHAILGVFGLLSLAAAIAWIPAVQAMPWTQPVLELTAYPAFSDSIVSSQHFGSVPQMIEAYRAASHVPAPAPSAFSGQAKNYNVILFVMEAITAQSFDPARDSLSDMPNVRRLRDHSFLMGRHYTSYPATNAAAFSIFTSLYEKSSSGNLIDKQIEIPGLIHSLRQSGYQTGYYGYVWKVPSQRDDRMLASLGFDKIGEPTIDASLDREGDATFYGPVEYTESHDLQALGSLRQQIHSWTASRQRFCAAYFPEIGHDPYRELSGRSSRSELERGHALAVLQDAWLGQLMDELRRDGALENTIIVLTADHGMRFLADKDGHAYSRFSNGKLEDARMRVPMMIYVPGVLKHSVPINDPTSHIDIAPTLQDLLGIPAGRELEQGSPVYSQEIAKRRLFLPMDVFGASGFYYGGTYYSRGPIGVVYKSATLNFANDSALRFESKEAEDIRELLAEQDSRQMAILSHVLQGEYH